jgi:hypothetical protein
MLIDAADNWWPFWQCIYEEEILPLWDKLGKLRADIHAISITNGILKAAGHRPLSLRKKSRIIRGRRYSTRHTAKPTIARIAKMITALQEAALIATKAAEILEKKGPHRWTVKQLRDVWREAGGKLCGKDLIFDKWVKTLPESLRARPGRPPKKI